MPAPLLDHHTLPSRHFHQPLPAALIQGRIVFPAIGILLWGNYPITTHGMPLILNDVMWRFRIDSAALRKKYAPPEQALDQLNSQIAH